MELLQWIVPEEDGRLSVAFTPVWADRLHVRGRWLARRSAPLVSRWLPYPLVVGVREPSSAGTPRSPSSAGTPRSPSSAGTPRSPSSPSRGVPSAPGVVACTLAFTTVDGAAPVVDVVGVVGVDELRVAGVFAELVRVIADLCEAAALPVLSIAPLSSTPPKANANELCVAFGSVGNLSVDALADALLALRVAVDLASQARGVALARASLRVDDGPPAAVDAHVHGALDAALQAREDRAPTLQREQREQREQR